ncbi:MAG TPA: polysaccharide biosynthesis C-terminal domain-containing protein, partial [Atribacterota bacterium]|nr:polysaccharide biosynthesis C-terminal domain-containing protein [Atribacterota bacterium]
GAAGYFMNMTGCQVVLQRITFVTVIIGLLLNIYLIPIYGIEGAAGATALAICIWNIWCVIYIKKRYNIGVYYIPGFLRKR